jgi:hypothetical protein
MVHDALGGDAYDRASNCADRCSGRSAGQSDDGAGHRASGGGPACRGVRLTRRGSACLEFGIRFGIHFSIRELEILACIHAGAPTALRVPPGSLLVGAAAPGSTGGPVEPLAQRVT